MRLGLEFMIGGLGVKFFDLHQRNSWKVLGCTLDNLSQIIPSLSKNMEEISSMDIGGVGANSFDNIGEVVVNLHDKKGFWGE
jgi:hypothetical protein